MKKSIIFVSYNYWPPQFGGELILSIERFQGLTTRGFDITALVSGYPGFSSQQDNYGILIRRSPAIGYNRLARVIRRLIYPFWAFYMVIKAKFDIYYQGDTAGIDPASSAIIVWVLTRIARWKNAQTVTVHSLASTEDRTFNTTSWGGFWMRILYSCFETIVSVSPGLHQHLHSAFPKAANLIINGIRDDIFFPLKETDRQFFRQTHGVQENQVIFTFLGTVGYRKGFDLLATAFQNLAKRYPHWRLWVIGPHTRQHSQNIDHLDVERVTHPLASIKNQVRYWGRIDNRSHLNTLLSASDIFVFPSRREGMGLAPMEAMATGTPVIIARIPDVTDLASVEGETGYYVPVEDASALQVAMEKLGCNPTLRKKMGRNAVQRIRKVFGWVPHLDQWKQLFER